MSTALTGKQKRFLRRLGHALHPVIMIGKHGTNETLSRETNKAIESHELIKIKVLETCDDSIDEVAQYLAQNNNAQIAQIIGRTALLYRRRAEDPAIELPKSPR